MSDASHKVSARAARKHFRPMFPWVSEETWLKIDAAAAELQLHPDQVAAQLLEHAVRTIAAPSS